MALEQQDIELSRSPLSFYGIDEKYIPRGCFIACANCNKIEQERKTFKTCLKCRQLNVQKYEPMYHHYCSKECQKEHWKIHRLEHIRYETHKTHLLSHPQEESDDQKAERKDTLPDDPIVKVGGEGDNNKSSKELCEELEKLAKKEVDDGELTNAVAMVDRASSPIPEHVGMPDKVHFNLAAGTSSARFCLGQKITTSEGGVNKSTVALLKQETGPDGSVRATTTPVYQEDVILPKRVWKQQVPMGKHPSKNLEDRGGKKDAAISPPQKGDLTLTKNGKKSSRKSGRGSGKVVKKGEETVLDISAVPPSKVSSEPFWRPDGRIAGKKSLPPPTSVNLNGSVTALPTSVSLKSSMTGIMSGSEQEDEPPKPPPKEVAKPKPKKKKEHEVKDVSSLSNKYVTVVDVNECAPLEPKHYETDTSSSGDDAGGYMMYILTDEVDGTRSAVVQKRKNKRKRNFNPRILFEKEHMKKKRSIPRKDGKPRQEVTFHFSHPSDEEDDEESSTGTSNSSDLKAITNIMQSATSKTKETSASKAEKTSKDGKSSTGIKDKAKVTSKASEDKTPTDKEKNASKVSESKGVKAVQTGKEKPQSTSAAGTETSQADKGKTSSKVSKAKTEVTPPADAGKTTSTVSESGSKQVAQTDSAKTASEGSEAKTAATGKPDKRKPASKASGNKSAKSAQKTQSANAPETKTDQKEPKVGAEVAPTDADTATTTEKPKLDPGVMVRSVCKKINVAFGEEMPRARIIEVTASDDEIEQVVIKKSEDHLDKMLKRHEKKPASAQNTEATVKKDEGETPESLPADEGETPSVQTNEGEAPESVQTNEGEAPESVQPANESQELHTSSASGEASDEVPPEAQSSENKPGVTNEEEKSPADAEKVGDGEVVSSVESAPELQNSNNSNGKSAAHTEQEKVADAPGTDDTECQKHQESKTTPDEKPKNRTLENSDASESDGYDPTEFITRLASIIDPEGYRDAQIRAERAIRESLEKRNFVLENAAYAGQDLEVTIQRTRATPAQDPALDENCSLRYYVSRKIKIPSKSEQNASQNDATFFRGKEGVVQKQSSEPSDDKEASGDQPPAKDTAEPSDEKSSLSTEDSQPPLVEYNMSSQVKSNPSESDLKSTGSFRVLNSDKVFGDIYSDESISQLSNPSVDVSQIFNTDNIATTEVPPLDYSSQNTENLKDLSPLENASGEAKKSETSTPIDDTNGETKESKTSVSPDNTSIETKKSEISVPLDDTTIATKKCETSVVDDTSEETGKSTTFTHLTMVETNKPETSAPLSDTSGEPEKSETSASVGDASDENENSDTPAPVNDATEGTEKSNTPSPHDDAGSETENSETEPVKTTPVKLVVQSAPYVTALCTRPQYETTIILRQGQFGFLVSTEGDYRIFTHVYAKKRWSDEEVEGK